MGTVSETSGNQVTMDDFKYLESTMSSQMSELREMIVQLMQAKAPSAPPPLEFTATLNRDEVGWKKRMPIKIKIKRLIHLLRTTEKVNSLIGSPPTRWSLTLI
jgi:hypothetical protein